MLLASRRGVRVRRRRARAQVLRRRPQSDVRLLNARLLRASPATRPARRDVARCGMLRPTNALRMGTRPAGMRNAEAGRMTRLAALSGLVCAVAACGGQESGGISPFATTSAATSTTSTSAISTSSKRTVQGSTSNVSTSEASQGTSTGPLPPCVNVNGFSLPPINVGGVNCSRGGPLNGGCYEGEPACSFCAIPVLCTPTFGPRTFYDCTCVGSTWSCTVASQDTAVCSSDGGEADASIVVTDGAVCTSGQILCAVGCSNQVGCYPGPTCPPPPPCPPPR
jgi:hypothetical protein